MNIKEYLQRKKSEPLYWDRLAMVLIGNIMIAMGIIALIEDGSISGALFGFNIGFICHWFFWNGKRIKVI